MSLSDISSPETPPSLIPRFSESPMPGDVFLAGWRRRSFCPSELGGSPAAFEPAAFRPRSNECTPRHEWDAGDDRVRAIARGHPGYSFAVEPDAKGHSLLLYISLGGVRRFPVALSSVRRTLTISSSDCKRYDLSALPEELVTSTRSKRFQLYCGQVDILGAGASHVAPPADASTTPDDCPTASVARMDYYVNRGKFRSRIGLIGCRRGRSLFCHLGLGDEDSVALVGLDTQNTRLLLGSRARPPASAIPCPLLPCSDRRGKFVALFIESISLSDGGPRISLSRGGRTGRPLPAIVHLEVPGLCLPAPSYKDLMDGLDSVRADPVGRRMPTIRIKVRAAPRRRPGCPADGSFTLSLRPEDYDEGGMLLVSPIASDDDDRMGACVVLGNRCFRECGNMSWSIRRGMIHFWR